MVDALKKHKLKNGNTISTFAKEMGRILEVVVRGSDQATVTSREVRDLVVSLRADYDNFSKAGMDPNPADSSTEVQNKKKKPTSEFKRIYRFVAI